MDAPRAKAALEGRRLYDRNHDSYHYYEIEGVICTINEHCTLEKVAHFNRMHPAPGTFSSTTPVVSGQLGMASLGYEGTKLDDFGPIIHQVSEDGLTVVNITAEGHRLYPGYVRRTVFRKGDDIYIRTVGEGIGAMPRINEDFASALWNGLVNSHIRYRINLQYRVEHHAR